MSVHFAPPYPVETASRVLHDNSLYPDRQPRRDPTWIGIVAFTFLAGVLLAWHATASDTPLDSATMAALEQGEIRSEEHTSELQSLMRTSYAAFCLKTTSNNNTKRIPTSRSPQS